MRKHGLQEMHGRTLTLPARRPDHPDRERLAWRWASSPADPVAGRGRPDFDTDVTVVDFDFDVEYDDFDFAVNDAQGGAVARVRGEVPTPEALGRMLQQGRLVKGMSQRALADQLGIGQKWVWEMESGKPGLFTERLFAMLRATGVHLHAEIDVPDEPAPDDAPTHDDPADDEPGGP